MSETPEKQEYFKDHLVVRHPDGKSDKFSVPDDEVIDLLGDRFRIDRLSELDVLAENERFRQRGLTRLSERVYSLRPLR